MSNRVAVIGAGWSGIYALKWLKQHGLEATVFEKSQSLGGVWRTLICVVVSEWHARDRWVPMEGVPGQAVFEVEEP